MYIYIYIRNELQSELYPSPTTAGCVKGHFSQLLGAVFDGSGTVRFHRAVAAPLILRLVAACPRDNRNPGSGEPGNSWPTQKKYRWLPGSKLTVGA